MSRSPDIIGVVDITVMANSRRSWSEKHTKALRAYLTISPHYGLTCYLAGRLQIRKTCLPQISARRHIAGSKTDKQELCLKHILLLFYIKPLPVRNKSTYGTSIPGLWIITGKKIPPNPVLVSVNVWTSGEMYIYLSNGSILNTVYAEPLWRKADGACMLCF